MRQIKPEDLDITVYRAGVLGGDVSVRVRHMPSGEVVTVNGKSELACKAQAMVDLQGILNDEGMDLGVTDQRTLSEHLADLDVVGYSFTSGIVGETADAIIEAVKKWIDSYIEAGGMTLENLYEGADQ